MTMEGVAGMIGIAAIVSGGSIFVVGLMIRASITDATSKLAAEIHTVLDGKYVTKEAHEKDMLLVRRDIDETRRGIEWLEGLMEKR
jgi:hypothetical protein